MANAGTALFAPEFDPGIEGSGIAARSCMDDRPNTATHHTSADAGFGLVEAIVAAGMLATLAVGVAQVFGLSARAVHVARVRSLGAVLAAQKMEQLQSLALTHGPAGERLTDTATNLAADPPSDGGPGLNPSPPGSLDADVPFYVDYANAAGTIVASREAAAYVRRWAVTPMSFDPDNMLMLNVRVLTTSGLDTRVAGIKARRR
jgi:type II secretory pathway pseudopilin PulG